jgi:hypothetical protein
MYGLEERVRSADELLANATLIRAGALTAIVGGSLRAAASFAPIVIESGFWRESLYVAVDTCLALGLLAFYSQHSKRLGPWGTTGLVASLVGIAAIRVNRFVSTADLYPVGAFAVACGVMILAIRAWIVKEIHGWVPAAFAASMLLGIVGSVVQGANALFVCSGVIFGVAFTGVGIETWTRSVRRSDARTTVGGRAV